MTVKIIMLATLKTEPELVEDVIREAFHHLNRKAALHDVRVEVDDPLLMAQMDGRLIMQVIINLVNNAVTYTPEPPMFAAWARIRRILSSLPDFVRT